MQARGGGGLVAGLAGRRNVQCIIEELQGAAGGLLRIAPFQGIGQFEQGLESGGPGDHQVAQVGAQRGDEMQGVEALGEHLVEQQERLPVVSREEMVHQRETVFIVQDIEVADDVGIMDIAPAEGHRLVEDGQRVTHRPVGLHRDDMEGLVVDRDPLLRGDAAEVLHDVRDGDPVEIVGLAAGKDGREDLVLLGRRQDEDRMGRRLLEGLEEGIEGRGREHMDLIDDIDAVFAHLRRDLDLVHQRLDVLHAVVRGRIHLMDAVGASLLEGDAGLAVPARLHLRPRIGAVDHLREDPRRRRLSHPARPAEQVRVGKLPPLDRIGQRPRDRILADQRLEGVRPVLPR